MTLHSIIIALFLIANLVLGAGCSGSRSAPTTISAMTLRGDTVHLLQPLFTITVVVFANNYSCVSCFASVSQALMAQEWDSTNVEIVIVSRPGPGSMERRRSHDFWKRMLPAARRIIFDIQSSPDAYPPVSDGEGLLGILQIRNTPAVAIWSNRSIEPLLVLPYSTLFETGETHIRPQALMAIQSVVSQQ